MIRNIAFTILALGILVAALAGLRPDPYLTGVRALPLPHPYPIETLAWVALLMSVQVIVLFSILRPRTFRASYGRAIAGVGVSLLFLTIGGLGAMHSPPPWGVYILWLLVVLAGMLALFGWSVVVAARSRHGT